MIYIKDGPRTIEWPDQHPCILSFGQTDQYDFPLILVIGREPSYSGKVSDQIGYYLLNEEDDCDFWKYSYEFISEICTDSKGELKDMCLREKISPIIYADASDLCIPGNNNSKDWERKSNKVNESFPGHIMQILKHESLLKRVRLIILSGHEKKYLSLFKIFT